MSRHTIVIDFTGVQEPAYGAGMEVLGGKVVAVAFADEMERAEQLETQRDELLEALEEIESLIEQDNQTAHEIAVTAIARARGES